MSKTVELVIGNVLGRFFEESNAFGKNQWAFRRGHRYLVAMMVLKWILELHAGNKVGFLLADISGAFDRVKADLLIEKLIAAVVQDGMLRFLASYLQP